MEYSPEINSYKQTPSPQDNQSPTSKNQTNPAEKHYAFSRKAEITIALTRLSIDDIRTGHSANTRVSKPLSGLITIPAPGSPALFEEQRDQDERSVKEFYGLSEDTVFENVSSGASAVIKKVTGSKQGEIAVKLSQFNRGSNTGLANTSFTLNKGEFLGLTIPDHPNVVKTRGILLFNNKQKEYLLIQQQSEIPRTNKADYEVRASILELVKSSDLRDLLCDDNLELGITLAHDVIRKICDALNHLHIHGLIYRDLKPENILYSPPSKDTDSLVKLCDMGFLKQLKKNEKTTTCCGSLEYLAPEIIEKKSYTHSVDIWGLGLIYYELLTGCLPFDTLPNITRQKNLILDFARMTASDKKKYLLEKAPSTFIGDRELLNQPLDIIARLTEYNPDERMSLEDLKAELSGVSSPALKYDALMPNVT